MLKGDLATTTVEAVLSDLAEEQATGCLHVSDADGEEALVYFKNGLVYAVSVPGRRPQLGARLISSGALAPEGLAEALEAQREELQGWRLGELLVHLGYVDRAVVEGFVAETVRDAMTDLVRWRAGRWRFRKSERTREDVATPATVEDLLADVRQRQEQWEDSFRDRARTERRARALDSWGELGRDDPRPRCVVIALQGRWPNGRSPSSRDGGFTLLEAARVVVMLVQAGLVDVEEDVSSAVPPPAAAANDDRDPTDVAMSLAAAFREPSESAADVEHAAAAAAAEAQPLSAEPAAELAELAAAFDPGPPLSFAHHDDFADSIARVSAALSQLLGPQSTLGAPEDLFDVPDHLRVGAASARLPSSSSRPRTRSASACVRPRRPSWLRHTRWPRRCATRRRIAAKSRLHRWCS